MSTCIISRSDRLSTFATLRRNASRRWREINCPWLPGSRDLQAPLTQTSFCKVAPEEAEAFVQSARAQSSVALGAGVAYMSPACRIRRLGIYGVLRFLPRHRPIGCGRSTECREHLLRAFSPRFLFPAAQLPLGRFPGCSGSCFLRMLQSRPSAQFGGGGECCEGQV